MANLILGEHPDRLEVRLVHGDGAVLVATLTDTAGDPVAWADAPSLAFGTLVGNTYTAITTHEAVTAGEHATWSLSVAQVEAIHAGSETRNGSLSTLARITVPDGTDPDGKVTHAGSVKWSNGWQAGDQTQVVTFTLPGGAAGPAGPAGPTGATGAAGPAGADGASAYEVAVANGFAGTETEWLASLVGADGQDGTGGDGGAVTIVSTSPLSLPTGLDDGATRVYRLVNETVVDGATLAAGTYFFERDDRVTSGWTYRLVAQGSELVADQVDPPVDVETTPQEPVWDDGLLIVTIPDIDGVAYTLDGQAVAPGDYPMTAGTTYQAAATPETGYVFPDGIATTWSHTVPASNEWTESFSDTLTSPLGEITARDGWTINNAASGNDHITIDATGAYLTGNTSMLATNPVNAIQHAVEASYDYTDGWGGTGGGLDMLVAVSWGSHTVRLRANDGGAGAGCVMTFVGTDGWPDMAAEDGVNLSTLPRSGVLRVESDGTYITAYIDGTLVASGLRHSGNNPDWAGPPHGSRILASGFANTAEKRRVTNVVMETK